MKKYLGLLLGLILFSFGCSSQEVPQASKGRMFEKTGALALWSGSKGFTGPILPSGTYYTGIYNEIKILECATITKKESLQSLTKDGVQFGIDIYIRFSANCDNENAVNQILDKWSPGYTEDAAHPEWKHIIFGVQLYDGIIRPAIGSSIRKSVSPYIANEINSNREKIFAEAGDHFMKEIEKQKPKLVNIIEINYSNLDFPDELDKANVARAEQAILKDKAIAEREKVTAEIETTNMRKSLVQSESNNEAARINALGEAWRKNPEYLQLKALEAAAEKGNLIVVNPGTPIILQKK